MTTSTAALRPGLVSITFRALPREEVIDLAAANGLEGIEWGGDVHVPPGDLSAAEDAARRTRDAGLVVAAYGSYFRCQPDEDFGPVLDSADALGAPLIRVWAGKGGSDETDEATRRGVVDVLRDISERAGDRGVTVAAEWHGGTLTDTPDSGLRLLEEVAHRNFRSYWQPAKGRDVAARRAELEAVLPSLAHVHVFEWRDVADGADRRPLAEGEPHWPGYLDLAATAPPLPDRRDRFALLEFVRDHDPNQLPDDAAALVRWLKRSR